MTCNAQSILHTVESNVYVSSRFPAEISIMVVDNDSKCNQLLARAPTCLKKLIATSDARSPTIQRAKNRGIEVLYFWNVENQGASRVQPEKVKYFFE